MTTTTIDPLMIRTVALVLIDLKWALVTLSWAAVTFVEETISSLFLDIDISFF